jgi:hypothetical protein
MFTTAALILGGVVLVFAALILLWAKQGDYGD